VSRPRHAFGNQPGRLPATLLRALSAELSDPSRYRRAKDYARDGAVIEIDVREGVVAGQVLGSRRDPYEVMIYVDPIDDAELEAARLRKSAVPLLPERTELALTCTCPDASGGGMCKHALALLMVFADEVSIEPDLLSRWRTNGPESPAAHSGATRLRSSAATDATSGRLADRASIGARSASARRSTPAPAPPRVDVLATVLSSPRPIGEVPDIPALAATALVTTESRQDVTSRLIDALVEDALAHLRR
jgi:uncharacterized Zn finger protein